MDAMIYADLAMKDGVFQGVLHNHPAPEGMSVRLHCNNQEVKIIQLRYYDRNIGEGTLHRGNTCWEGQCDENGAPWRVTAEFGSNRLVFEEMPK